MPWVVSRLASGPRLASARSTPARHSSIRDRRIQNGAAAAVKRHADRGVAVRGERPVERHAQVVRLAPVGREPIRGGLRDPVLAGLRKQVAVMLGMASCERVELAAFRELLEGVGTHRIEQPVLCDRTAHFGRDERLRHQVREIVDHVRCDDVFAGYHGRCGLQRERPGEDRQAAQDHALHGGEQFVAPVERRAQRLVARQRRALAAGQQTEAVVQACGQPFDPRAPPLAPRPARSRAGCRRAAGRSPRSTRCGRPDENCGSAARVRAMNRRTAPDLSSSVRSSVSSRRHLERRHAVDGLAFGAQRFATGDQHAGDRARAEHRFGHVQPPLRSRARSCRARAGCASSAECSRDPSPAAVPRWRRSVRAPMRRWRGPVPDR